MGVQPYNAGFQPSGGVYSGLNSSPPGVDSTSSGTTSSDFPYSPKSLKEPAVDSFTYSGQGNADSTQPDAKLTDFNQLTPEMVRSQGDIKGIAFDVDDTLSEFKLLGDRSIPPELKQRLKTLQDSGIKLGMISNNPSSSTVLQFQKELADSGINMAVISNAQKPGTEGLEMMSKEFGVPLNQMMMVGDSKNTDVASGEKAGVKTVQVDWFGTSDLHKEGMSLLDKVASVFNKVKGVFSPGSEQPEFFPPPAESKSSPVPVAS